MHIDIEMRLLESVKPFRGQISDYAFDLIRYSIDMVERDAHPSWQDKSPTDRRSAQAKAIEELPDFLKDLLSKSKAGRVTTFDVLHRISSFVDRVCPFDKE